ncbi:MAG: CoA transferase [Myxococcales bacterium]|nr:CoA transferase [Myxococcales bacterium]
MSDALQSAPLSGLRVIDFTRILAGPFCTMILGDLGAEVIKIERPGRGDDTRSWGPPFIGELSAYFIAVNRNKRSLALDLRSERGLAIARQLVASGDVVVHNFRPGVADKLGLGYDAVRAIKEDIVYCTVSGFGLDGPYAKRPGYDALIQGMGGLMSITGEPDGAPTKSGVAITDLACGMFSLAGILAALVGRERTGRGDHVDVSLLDSAVALLVNQAQSYLLTGEVPVRLGNAHPTIVPYETFVAADGPFIVAVGNNTQFARLCEVIGAPELSRDARYLDNPTRVVNRASLVEALAARFAAKPREHWVRALQDAAVPSGPINDLADVFGDPQVAAREMARAVEHAALGPLRLVGSPIKLRCSERAAMSPPPLVGQHSAEVLSELCGLGDEEIAALREAKVI